MRVIKPPQITPYRHHHIRIFLAGAIDMGEADDWQTQAQRYLEAQETLAAQEGLEFLVFNPRRDDWDNGINNHTIEDPAFYQQVMWELGALQTSDIILLHLPKDAKAPISLMELGLYANQDRVKVVVSCEQGFYRRGNVEAVCEFYEIPLFDNLFKSVDFITDHYKSYVNVKS